MGKADGDGDGWKTAKDAQKEASAGWGAWKKIGKAFGTEAEESLPFFGIGAAAYNIATHSAKAQDAHRKHEFDEEDYYRGEANYDWIKGVPFLGGALGIAELAGGVVNAVQGGEFVEGMNLVKDGTIDLVHDSDKSHTDLRHNHEEREHMEAFVKAQKEAQREAKVDPNMRGGGTSGPGNAGDSAENERRQRERWDADARRRDREANVDPQMRNGGSEGAGNVPDPDAAERRREAEAAAAERERRVDPNMRDGGSEGAGNY